MLNRTISSSSFDLIGSSLGFAIGGGAVYLLTLFAGWLYETLQTLFCFTLKTTNPFVWTSVSRSHSWTKVILFGKKERLDEGTYFLWNPFFVVLQIKRNPKGGTTCLIFTTFRFSAKKLRHFIADLNQKAGSSIDIYKISQYREWVSPGESFVNPDTTILRAGQFEEIQADVLQFKSRETWYHSMGIPYRRGYLFYGPPGTGKTTTASTIALWLGKKLAICKAVKFSHLIDAMNNSLYLDNAVILLDDIDELLMQEDFKLGDLLSTIDNLGETGCIVILTCNDPSKLPPKLIRSGRIDKKWKFDFADENQIEKTLLKFYPELEETVSKKFILDCREASPVTTADIQEFLLSNEDLSQITCFLNSRKQQNMDLKTNFNMEI